MNSENWYPPHSHHHTSYQSSSRSSLQHHRHHHFEYGNNNHHEQQMMHHQQYPQQQQQQQQQQPHQPPLQQSYHPPPPQQTQRHYHSYARGGRASNNSNSNNHPQVHPSYSRDHYARETPRSSYPPHHHSNHNSHQYQQAQPPPSYHSHIHNAHHGTYHPGGTGSTQHQYYNHHHRPDQYQNAYNSNNNQYPTNHHHQQYFHDEHTAGQQLLLRRNHETPPQIMGEDGINNNNNAGIYNGPPVSALLPRGGGGDRRETFMQPPNSGSSSGSSNNTDNNNNNNRRTSFGFPINTSAMVPTPTIVSQSGGRDSSPPGLIPTPKNNNQTSPEIQNNNTQGSAHGGSKNINKDSQDKDFRDASLLMKLRTKSSESPGDSPSTIPSLKEDPSFTTVETTSKPSSRKIDTSLPVSCFPAKVPKNYPKRLALPNDHVKLNNLHCFLREQLLEIFVVEENRNKQTKFKHAPSSAVGRVGFRCVFCAKKRKSCDEIAPEDEAPMAVFYPKSTSEIYRLVTSWQRCHVRRCRTLPPSLRNQWNMLRETEKARGKTSYWIDSAKQIGLIDCQSRAGGIRFDVKDEEDDNHDNDNNDNEMKVDDVEQEEKEKQMSKIKIESPSPNKKVENEEKDTEKLISDLESAKESTNGEDQMDIDVSDHKQTSSEKELGSPKEKIKEVPELQSEKLKSDIAKDNSSGDDRMDDDVSEHKETSPKEKVKDMPEVQTQKITKNNHSDTTDQNKHNLEKGGSKSTTSKDDIIDEDCMDQDVSEKLQTNTKNGQSISSKDDIDEDRMDQDVSETTQSNPKRGRSMTSKDGNDEDRKNQDVLETKQTNNREKGLTSFEDEHKKEPKVEIARSIYTFSDVKDGNKQSTAICDGNLASSKGDSDEDCRDEDVSDNKKQTTINKKQSNELNSRKFQFSLNTSGRRNPSTICPKRFDNVNIENPSKKPSTHGEENAKPVIINNNTLLRNMEEKTGGSSSSLGNGPLTDANKNQADR